MELKGRLIPYIGYEDFKLYSDFSTILNQLKNKIISIVYLGYKNEIIRIDTKDSLMFFFVAENNKLFKIRVSAGAECLLNGVSVIGLHESKLYELYPNLYYDDMEEVFETKQGVFFETDPITHCVVAANTYIEEIDDEDDKRFYDYKW